MQKKFEKYYFLTTFTFFLTFISVQKITKRLGQRTDRYLNFSFKAKRKKDAKLEITMVL